MGIATIPQAIARGDVSIYLAANYNAKQSLFGGRPLNPGSPVSIAMITDALRWGYDGGAQTAITLRSTANYLVWLCGIWGQQAATIIAGGGGGSVVPVNPPVDSIISPIQITGGDFSSTRKWTGTNDDGIVILPTYTLQVYWNTLSRFLIQFDEWDRTDTGFDINVNGTTITEFDALGANINDVFFIFISP